MFYQFNRQPFNRPSGETKEVAISLTSQSNFIAHPSDATLISITYSSNSSFVAGVINTRATSLQVTSKSSVNLAQHLVAASQLNVSAASNITYDYFINKHMGNIIYTSTSRLSTKVLRQKLVDTQINNASRITSRIAPVRTTGLQVSSKSIVTLTQYIVAATSLTATGASRITYRPVAVRRIRPVDYAAHSSFEAAVTRQRYAVVKYNTHSSFEAYPLPTYTDAINDHSRTFTSRVEIYFDGPAAPPITITDTELVSFVLLEELRAQTDTPLGDISANEFEISLYNEDRRLSQANKDSDLYGKLKPGIMLKPYISLVLRDTESLEFELGTFYAGDWVTASTSVVCNTVCYDRLKDIMKIPYDGLRVQTGLTFKELFEIVFTLANVPSTDFNISNELSTVVDKAYIPGNTIGDALKYLAEASGSYVTVDRRNMIQVFKPNYTASPRATLTENNQLFTHTQPTRYLEMYTALDIPYHKTSVRDQELLVHINELEIDVGEFVSKHKLRRVPVSMVNKIDLQGPSGVSLKYYTATAETITLYLDNSTGEKQTISAKVFGTGVDFVEEPVGRDYPDISQLIDKKELRIDNKLLQSKQASDALLDMIEVVTSNPSAHISASIRGDLRVLPGDTVEISDANKKLDKQRVLVTTSTLEYSGAVSGSLEGYVVGGEE